MNVRKTKSNLGKPSPSTQYVAFYAAKTYFLVWLVSKTNLGNPFVGPDDVPAVHRSSQTL